MLRLAWRNVWRNGRRSLVTVASLACGLAAILFGQSLVKTIQFQLIEKSTGVIIGHLQVLDSRTRSYKFPEHPIRDAAAVERRLARLGGVAAFEGRILVTGLVSSEKDSLGALLVGVEPEKDARIATIHSYVNAGSFLTGRPGEALMGDKMAVKLGLGVGQEAVVLSQAADGTMGARKFRLAGTYHTGSETFDGQILYLELGSFQEMLAMEGQVNDFVVRLKDPERLEEALAGLRLALGGLPVRALSWREVDPELVGIQRYQNAILAVMLAIVFAIVALGVLNALLMTMFERVREFGVLMALGARPGWVLRLVLTEASLLGAVGAAAGALAGSALILHFGRAGLELPLKDAIGFFLPFDAVLYLRFAWASHRTALAAVMATAVLAALPPALRAARLKPAEALRRT